MSPLTRRIPRELRNNLGRYLGLFFLVFLAVAFAGGCITGARSIQLLLADWKATSAVEDYSFSTQFQASDEALDAAADAHGGSTIYENFYADVPLTVPGRDLGHEATVRLYKNRTEVDKASYYTGRAPQSDDEIALDRLFMANNGLSLGDTVEVAGRRLTIVGQCVLPDYEALVVSDTDLMFDTITFTTAQVTADAFPALAGASTVWHYSAVCNDANLTDKGRTDLQKDVAQALMDHDATLTALTDRTQNNAMTFTDDDLVGDSTMYGIVGLLIICISGFVFVVLTGANIEQESAVIGTLLASGYRKHELVRHYMVLPTVVGLVATVAGRLVATTLMAHVDADMYYGSYSLPPFRTYFSLDVFLATTVLPLALLVLITWLGIRRRLGATPLAFLRHEVGRRSATSSARLPERWSFVARFRLRVFLRNASHFAVLLLGIVVCTILMLFAICFLPVVRSAAALMESGVVAQHLYTLKAPVEIDLTSGQLAVGHALDLRSTSTTPNSLTDQELAALMLMTQDDDPSLPTGHIPNGYRTSAEAVAQAEKFCATNLEADRTYSDSMETVTVYGIEEDSRYWDVDVSDGRICVGRGLAEKCGTGAGSVLSLYDKYADKTYTLSVAAEVGNETDMGVYMSRKTFVKSFDDLTGGDAEWFCGYASDEPLQLTQSYVAGEVTPEDMAKAVDQLETSMGNIMTMVLAMTVPFAMVVIYLLTKTVIDRSATPIAYMKVFGYRDREVDGLYIRAITITVVASLVISAPVAVAALKGLFLVGMGSYQGNYPLLIEPPSYLQTMGLEFAAYAVVALLNMRRIRKVRLAEALKVQE